MDTWAIWAQGIKACNLGVNGVLETCSNCHAGCFTRMNHGVSNKEDWDSKDWESFVRLRMTFTIVCMFVWKELTN